MKRAVFFEGHDASKVPGYCPFCGGPDDCLTHYAGYNVQPDGLVLFYLRPELPQGNLKPTLQPQLPGLQEQGPQQAPPTSGHTATAASESAAIRKLCEMAGAIDF